jgi:hypothetical protein
MTRQLVLSVVALTLTVMAGGTALVAQAFGARTGAWVFTITMKGDIPVEGLPPEAAAQIRAEMSKPQTMNSCLTAEDLKEFNLGKTGDDDEDCKVLSSKFTATTADVTRECTGDSPYTETAHYEAPTPQTLTGNMSRKTATGTMTIAMTGKWAGAQCKE